MIAGRFVATLLFVVVAALALLLVWDPYPRTTRSFDRGHNGLWLGHKWYTGRYLRTEEPVGEEELTELVERFERYGIRYAYIHVGPIRADGGLDDSAGEILSRLRDAAPDVELHGWLGARVDRIPLATSEWRQAVVAASKRLVDEGFDGIHLDLEPLSDAEPGYLELLRSLRQELPPGTRLSQATPRAGPFGLSFGPLRRSLWSGAFYRETMALTDQTVLMAYDTRLSHAKPYVEFVRHQTGLVLDWACSIADHELLIGIPAYEDVPLYSDPIIENPRTASLGVRAALEARKQVPVCFEGVSVYAYWVADSDEWRTLEEYWIDPSELGVH